MLDRLIPRDEFPSATEGGVENYFIRQLASDCAREAQPLATGLSQLDAEATAQHGAGVTFHGLDATQQDALLRALEAGRVVTTWPAEVSPAAFFARMVDLAHEGYYADPANGGNRDAASWRMIGYDPRVPRNPPQTPPAVDSSSHAP